MFSSLQRIFNSRSAFCGLLALSLLASSCGSAPTTDNTSEQNTQETGDGSEQMAVQVDPKIYVDFVINTHDWVFPDKSEATLNKIIDIHEEYKVPVDIYLDDPIVQTYEKEDPALIERLKTSPYVAVSYHVRPPAPYAYGFDFLGLSEMSAQELADTLKEYETHALDLATGQPTSAPGGYEYLKALMGYAPYVVSSNQGGKIASAVNAVWKDMGAVFTVEHNKDTVLGEQSGGLFLRPEDVEVKAYEEAKSKSAEEVLTAAIAERTDSNKPFFINCKWHDNDFYAAETTWGYAYYADGDSHGTPLPQSEWDANAADFSSEVKMKTDKQVEKQWDFYEDIVKYASEHSSDFEVINSKDLAEMVQ